MFDDLTPNSQVLVPGETGHRFAVMRLASFHHSSRIASCSFDGTVRIWSGNRQEKVLFFFPEPIEGLQVTEDDQKVIVVLSNSSKAFVLHLRDNVIHEIGKNRSLVIRNIFGTNSSSELTAFLTFDDDLYLYDHISNTVSIKSVFVENSSGDALVWLDDERLVVPKRNGNLAVVDSSKMAIEEEISIHEGLITSICRDTDKIITVSEDGTGKVLSLDLKFVSGFKIPFTPVSVDFNAQNGIIAVTGDRNLLVVSTRSGDITVIPQELSGCNPIVLSDSTILKGTGEREISVFSLSGEIVSLLRGRTGSVEDVVFIEGSKLVIASGDKGVHLINYATGEDQLLAKHHETVSSLVHIQDKDIVIAASYDDTVSIWHLGRQEEIGRIKKVPLGSALAVSPMGDKFVVGCSGDNYLRVFTVEGKRMATWEAHEDYIGTVSYLNDDLIVSGSDTGLLKFWNRDGRLISSIQTDSPIKCFETTADYEYNITGHRSGAIKIFEKISNRLLQTYDASASVQCIKIINNKWVFFAAQETLYLMNLDNYHVISVQEICRHTEPVRGILWLEKANTVLTIDYSGEIIKTQFVSPDRASIAPESRFLEESTPSRITFAPSEDETGTSTQVGTSIPDEELIKIIEYLDTISNQISQLVAPKLEILGIEVESLSSRINAVREEVNQRITPGSTPSKTSEEEKEEETKSEPEDWRRLDWGGRRR
ncbi:MAG: WD40 repeat domain-containing protein [Candidatus Thorarchaeota archaeon]